MTNHTKDTMFNTFSGSKLRFALAMLVVHRSTPFELSFVRLLPHRQFHSIPLFEHGGIGTAVEHYISKRLRRPTGDIDPDPFRSDISQAIRCVFANNPVGIAQRVSEGRKGG